MTLSSSTLAAGCRILQSSPFTPALLWSNPWLFVESQSLGTALPPAWQRPGPAPERGTAQRPPFETPEFASSKTSAWGWGDVEQLRDSWAVWQALHSASSEVWYSFTESSRRYGGAKARPENIIRPREWNDSNSFVIRFYLAEFSKFSLQPCSYYSVPKPLFPRGCSNFSWFSMCSSSFAFFPVLRSTQNWAHK